MSIFGIGSVTLNDRGEITEALIAKIDPETRQPAEFVIKPAHEIASMIVVGEDVRGFFPVDGSIVLGGNFRSVVKQGGRETIDLEPNDMGWVVSDVSWREE